MTNLSVNRKYQEATKNSNNTSNNENILNHYLSSNTACKQLENMREKKNDLIVRQKLLEKEVILQLYLNSKSLIKTILRNLQVVEWKTLLFLLYCTFSGTEMVATLSFFFYEKQNVIKKLVPLKNIILEALITSYF